MVSSILEDRKALEEPAALEYYSIVDALDEQKISYPKIALLKVLSRMQRVMLLEQSKRTYSLLLDRLFNDPLSDSAASHLKSVVYNADRFKGSFMRKVLGERPEVNEGPANDLRLSRRYLNLSSH